MKIYIMDLQGLVSGIDEKIEINLSINRNNFISIIDAFLENNTEKCKSVTTHRQVIIEEIVINNEKIFDKIGRVEQNNLIYPVQLSYIFDKDKLYDFLNNLDESSIIKIMKSYEAKEINYTDIPNEIKRL